MTDLAAEATAERTPRSVGSAGGGDAGLAQRPYSTGTTGLPLPSGWCRYSLMPYPVRSVPSGST